MYLINNEFRVPKMMKWLAVFICILLIKTASGQPPANCNILTKYSSDGRPIKYISSESIDSTSDYKCAIGMENVGSYNYITLSFFFKTALKKMDGDLVVRFIDNSSINVPLTNCSNTAGLQNSTVITCSYIVLDKYVSLLRTRSIGTVVYRMSDDSYKAIELKQHNSVLKTAIGCLAP